MKIEDDNSIKQNRNATTAIKTIASIAYERPFSY